MFFDLSLTKDLLFVELDAVIVFPSKLRLSASTWVGFCFIGFLIGFGVEFFKLNFLKGDFNIFER